MDKQLPLTRQQLAREFQWELFPAAIQERLYRHYTTFVHEGDWHLAERDIQSASNTLEYLVLGARIDGCVSEHRGYFGEASATDLAEMVQQFRDLSSRGDHHPA